MLGRGVAADERRADQTAHRGGDDDRALSGGQHMGDDVLVAEKRPDQVDVDDLAESVGGVLVDRMEMALDPGIVEEDVDPAMRGDRFRHVVLHRGLVGHVGHHAGAARNIDGQSRKRCLVPIDGDDGSPSGRHQLGSRASDRPACTSDQCDLACQFSLVIHQRSPPLWIVGLHPVRGSPDRRPRRRRWCRIWCRPPCRPPCSGQGRCRRASAPGADSASLR